MPTCHILTIDTAKYILYISIIHVNVSMNIFTAISIGCIISNPNMQKHYIYNHHWISIVYDMNIIYHKYFITNRGGAAVVKCCSHVNTRGMRTPCSMFYGPKTLYCDLFNIIWCITTGTLGTNPQENLATAVIVIITIIIIISSSSWLHPDPHNDTVYNQSKHH